VGHQHLEAADRSQRDVQRGSAHQRGYTAEWRREALRFLVDRPLCECELHQAKPDAPAARVVDHIKPHHGDPVLFWDRSNWQALAKRCHDRKTAIEDGRWGRRRTCAA
jgi:5-methylcytosine-specific restriction protein A